MVLDRMSVLERMEYRVLDVFKLESVQAVLRWFPPISVTRIFLFFIRSCKLSTFIGMGTIYN